MSFVEMKDSGVDWLGEIPSHWEVSVIKRKIGRVWGGSWGVLDENEEDYIQAIVLRGTDFPGAEMGMLEGAPIRFVPRNEAIERRLGSGDMIVEISGGSEFQATGRALLITENLIHSAGVPLLCTNFAKALHVVGQSILHEFFWRCWSALYEIGVHFAYERRSTGIRNFQFGDFVSSEVIPLPPLDEQRAIANFLDRETAKLDALIHKSQRLIELLREKRQAVISHAVTKGLDEHAETRDSGVEWLGQIPSHWEARRLKYAVIVNPPKSDLRDMDESVEASFLPMPSIGEQGELDLSKRKPIAEVLKGYTYFQNDDVLVAKITPCFENGKGAIARGLLNGIGFGTTELFVLRPKSVTTSDFIYLTSVSLVFRRMGALSMHGAAGQQRVSEAFIRDYMIPLPPLHEQHAIAHFLDRETAKLDALIHKSERLITLLREKRKALISAAVTGKIDLRSEA